MELVEIFSGDTPTAMILQQALEDRHIASILQPREPLAALLGDRAMPPYSAVMISDHDAREHAQVIEECLALIGQAAEEQ